MWTILIAILGCSAGTATTGDQDSGVDGETPCTPSTWYRDYDGDAYGAPDSSGRPAVEACDAPDGYVANADDCDDGAGGEISFPGADEICDGVDNDCDGTTDDDPVDALLGYADLDGDGWGGGTPIEVCDLGDLDDMGDDCDDGDAETWPGAPEVYGDGLDQDCDGEVDEGCGTQEGDLDVAQVTERMNQGETMPIFRFTGSGGLCEVDCEQSGVTSRAFLSSTVECSDELPIPWTVEAPVYYCVEATASGDEGTASFYCSMSGEGLAEDIWLGVVVMPADDSPKP